MRQMQLTTASFLLCICACLLGLLCSKSAMAQDQAQQSVSVAEQYLINLRTMQTERALTHNQKPHIIMFMQPDCSWCKKQAKDLERLVANCSNALNVSVLGFKGNTSQLRREGRYFDQSVAIHKADTPLIKLMGGVSSSPTFVFLNSQNQLVTKQLGYLTPNKLFNAASIITQNECSIS